MACLWYMWLTNYLLNGMILQVGQWPQEELAATKRSCPNHHLDGCLDILSIVSIVSWWPFGLSFCLNGVVFIFFFVKRWSSWACQVFLSTLKNDRCWFGPSWGFFICFIEDAVASVLGFIIFLGGVFLVFLFMPWSKVSKYLKMIELNGVRSTNCRFQ